VSAAVQGSGRRKPTRPSPPRPAAISQAVLVEPAEQNIAEVNGDPGRPDAFDLDELSPARLDEMCNGLRWCQRMLPMSSTMNDRFQVNGSSRMSGQGEAVHRWGVEGRGCAHPQGLVGPLLVVLATPKVETTLLGPHVAPQTTVLVGRPFAMRSTRSPRRSHQTDNRVSVPAPWRRTANRCPSGWTPEARTRRTPGMGAPRRRRPRRR
jgi:hypothetical protein